jgi:hypothetical protein
MEEAEEALAVFQSQSLPRQVAAILLGLWAVLLLRRFLLFTSRWTRIAYGLRNMPGPSGGNLLLGDTLAMVSGRTWDVMFKWVEKVPIAKFRLLYRTGVLVGDAAGLKRVFQVWRGGGPAAVADGTLYTATTCLQPASLLAPV